MKATGSLTPLCCLLAALLLTACATDQAGKPGNEQAAAPVEPAASVARTVADGPAAKRGHGAENRLPERQIQPARKARQAQAPAENFARRPAVVPEPPPTVMPRPVPDLRQLIGMDRNGLNDLLGEPTLRRSEPPAEVWQYGAARCVLQVFLYRDGAGSRYRVSHVDAVRRGRPGAVPASRIQGAPFHQACYGRVLHRALAQNRTS